MTPSETQGSLVGAGRASRPEAAQPAEGSGRIALTINGEVRTAAADATLADVLRSLSLDPRTVVVEHNREILRDRDSYSSRRLHAGDVLELVHFVGGG